VGQATPTACAEFAYADTFATPAARNQSYLTLANTATTPVSVHVEAFLAVAGVKTTDATVAPQRRFTIDLSTLAGSGSDESPFGVRVTAPTGGSFIAEVPIYVSVVKDTATFTAPRAASVLLPTAC